jgi:hypothetical protein
MASGSTPTGAREAPLASDPDPKDLARGFRPAGLHGAPIPGRVALLMGRI